MITEELAKLLFELDHHMPWERLGDDSGPFTIKSVYLRRAEQIVAFFETHGWTDGKTSAKPAKRNEWAEVMGQKSDLPKKGLN